MGHTNTHDGGISAKAGDNGGCARERPNVSIIVPCFNAADTIRDTVESVRAQTHEAWELICVDDGSTDSTAESLAAFAANEPRIRVVNGRHAGAGAARNQGLRIARGEYVIFLDADDVARPDALAILTRVAESTGGDAIIAPGYELLDHDGRTLLRFRFPDVPEFTVDAMLRGNRLPPMSMAPASKLRCDPIDETLKGCIDWDFWISLAHAGVRCVAAPRVLFGYRLRKGSLSHSADRMFNAVGKLIQRWRPEARDPGAARDVLHRFACNYGAMAYATGDADAIRRYFATLDRIEYDEECLHAMAWHIRGAFEFVRGADGGTWAANADEWMKEIEPWLRQGPLADYAETILTHLAETPREQNNPVDAVREFADGRPNVRRVVVYGLGRNGVTLLERMRREPAFNSIDIRIADDHADELTFAVQDLPRDDPREWAVWPASTLAVVTPNECEPMLHTLEHAGGRAGADFLRLSEAPAPALATER